MSRRTAESKAHHDVRGTLGNLIACGDLLLDPALSHERIEELAKLVRLQAQAALDRFDLLSASPQDGAGEQWCPLALTDLLQFASTAAKESVRVERAAAQIDVNSENVYWEGDANFLGLILRECCRRVAGQSSASSILVSGAFAKERIEILFRFEFSSRKENRPFELQFPEVIATLLDAGDFRLSQAPAGIVGFVLSIPTVTQVPGDLK